MEDDNGGASRAAHEAPEEVGHVGAPRGSSRESRAEIGDLQGSQQLRIAGENPERTVVESRRSESESGGVHHQIQRGHENAEARIIESIHGDDKSWCLIHLILFSIIL